MRRPRNRNHVSNPEANANAAVVNDMKSVDDDESFAVGFVSDSQDMPRKIGMNQRSDFFDLSKLTQYLTTFLSAIQLSNRRADLLLRWCGRAPGQPGPYPDSFCQRAYWSCWATGCYCPWCAFTAASI